MAYRLPSLNALRVFEAAARHLSFKKAADELSVTPTAVSHQVRGLEDDLGFALFRRLTRALALTAEGEAMLPKVREGLDCFVDALARAQPRTRARRLFVVAPPTFASRWLVPRLRGFTNDNQLAELHLVGSKGTIDGSRDSESQKDRGDTGSDDSTVEIRFGTGNYPGLRVDRILSPTFIAVCDPQLTRCMLPLRTPSDICYHALIHDDTLPEDGERPDWTTWCKAAGLTGIDTDAGPHFSDLGLAMSAAEDGLGIAIAPQELITSELAEGRLVSPFDVRLTSPYGYFLVAREEIADRPVVSAFRKWLLAEARHNTIAQ